jgi:hypothetical protein
MGGWRICIYVMNMGNGWMVKMDCVRMGNGWMDGEDGLCEDGK